MLLFLYHLAWTSLILPLLPFIPLLKNERLSQRLGLDLPQAPLRPGTIWIHALSVGEVLSSLPLVKALRKDFPLRQILFSVTTSQGMEVARKELGGLVTGPVPMPLDLWWAMRRIVRYARPGLFILVESDLWPGLLHHLKAKGVPTLLVNGRISPRTYRSYMRFRPLTRFIFQGLDRCFTQCELDGKRLLRVGIPPAKVKALGNLKFDREWAPMDEEERDRWQHILGLRSEARVWVAGSTHQGEDEKILGVFERLRAHFPGLQLVIAPRRLGQAEEIVRLASGRGLKAVLRSTSRPYGDAYDILVLDTLGELGRVYGVGDVCFVGGSLVPVGGHNLLEPASLGRPVLFGPHTHNFVAMADLLLEAGGGIRVKDQEDLFQHMKDLLSHPEKAEGIGEKARAFVQVNTGTLDRVMEHVKPYLQENEPANRPS